MATRKRDRFFALFGAILFLGTSSALAIAILVSNIQSRHQPDGATSQPASSTAKQSANKLTGTKMQSYTPTTTPIAKLSYTDTKVGTGTEVKAGDTITADYTGWLSTTGVIFDAAADHGGPQTFSLSGVIAGWSQAIPGMRVGGTRRLFIPASLGYGSQGSGAAIPPNSDLVFDVTVQAIGQ
jgi:FKBP-type peptidyl-prolyl cis-trans isomerase FkpA